MNEEGLEALFALLQYQGWGDLFEENNRAA